MTEEALLTEALAALAQGVGDPVGEQAQQVALAPPRTHLVTPVGSGESQRWARGRETGRLPGRPLDDERVRVSSIGIR